MEKLMKKLALEYGFWFSADENYQLIRRPRYVAGIAVSDPVVSAEILQSKDMQTITIIMMHGCYSPLIEQYARALERKGAQVFLYSSKDRAFLEGMRVRIS
jgi:hypothetical protein